MGSAATSPYQARTAPAGAPMGTSPYGLSGPNVVPGISPYGPAASSAQPVYAQQPVYAPQPGYIPHGGVYPQGVTTPGYGGYPLPVACGPPVYAYDPNPGCRG